MHRVLTVGLVALALSTTGCAQRSAESAIAKAEGAVAAIQADAEKVAPTELKALTDSLAAMKARVATGDYSGAMMGARQAATMTRDLEANLATRRDQLNAAFTSISAELPKQLETVTAKVAELGAMKRVPAAIDAAKFATLKAEVGTWATAWTTASDAFKAGNLAEAMASANRIKAGVAAAMKTLGME